MSEQTEWEKWFKRWGDYGVHAAYYECNADFSVEDLYQMFKARLRAELHEPEEQSGCPHCGGGHS